ncbi:MAG: Ribonuclease 3 [Caldanaerobacter subterraneus]|uniref:Ribonuclease 3 n=2 Tax=Caldanaerobacter subterraneus TaxID=911092 RepID=A0A117KWI0_9THEO|nr:ribonuclease III [Caldanaerobacter subterraneus]ERM92417.1 ribonuclease III [Caldanaerobacter subterraneus subsp. yonseiensis KB-1]KUK09908.1 MAG: Ribonuclease 3 [Caldanaerobacter subterraneus]NNG66171.1 ribonuclease III [Caldanaerobacter subterraneus]TCO67827.1 RNAse III [Caldanaerobacter subterraneus]HBT49451.1 ribonuclease III [Caldanaerobacter subterraneus]
MLLCSLKNFERGIKVSKKVLTYLEQKINYEFKDKTLLLEALTHSSWAHEGKNEKVSNERLEFLGDSVLSLVISEYLYKNRKDLEEGSLSKYRAEIVCEPSLARCARKIELGSFLRMGKGEEISGGRDRDSILADAMEALLAAVYLDGGLEAVRRVILDLFKEIIDEVLKGIIYRDYKTRLQEVVQSMEVGKITYELVEEIGPDHNKTFVTQVKIGDVVLGIGQGKSKKESEQAAAMEALSKLGILK